MSIKIKQLESGLALLQWLEGLGDLGGIIYVKDGKLVITLPIEGTVVAGGSVDISDMATKTWVNNLLSDFTPTVSPGTSEDISHIEIKALQSTGVDIATVKIDDDIITLRCDLSALATIISPTFLGFPAAPEPVALSDDTSIATTSFVKKVLKMVTGIDVNKAVTDNIADLVEELLKRYSSLSGTNSTLENTIKDLLSKLQSPTTNPADIQSLILKIQELIVLQETAEHTPMSSVQQLVLKLRTTDPITGVDFNVLEDLLLRYAATGSNDITVGNIIDNMLSVDITEQQCNSLKTAIEGYLSSLTAQRNNTRKDIEDYLDGVQDILAIIQRLLTAYKGLPTSTPAINTAVKNLTDALAANATKEELKEKAAVLENLLRNYDFSSYGLTDNDKALQALLEDLEQKMAALYTRIFTAAEGSSYETDYNTFFTLLQSYKEKGNVSVEVLQLLEKLATALEKIKTGDTDPTLSTVTVQTINSLTSLLEQEGISIDELLKLLLTYRQYDGNDPDIADLLSKLAKFLTEGDTNNGAATDTVARELIDDLDKAISDIKALKEELINKQKDELDKKTDTVDESEILKTIKELSEAINNDPDFYKTITDLINEKVNNSGDTINGDLAITGNLSVQGTVTGSFQGDLEGTADKATTDINGKPIVNYVSDIALTGAQLVVTKGDSSTSRYDLPTSDGSTVVTYDLVTSTADGLARKEDYTKLQGIEENANKYELVKATDAVLGGVKIGANITNTDGKISITKDNVTAALGYTPANETAVSSGVDDSTLKEYVKTVNLSGQILTVSDGSGTSKTFTTQDTTYTIFTGANSSKAGKQGLVPAPSTGYHNRYLKGDGTWTKISASDIEGLSSATSGGGGGSTSTPVDLSDYLKTDTADSTYAPIASPSFTGSPTAPTPTSTTNSTRIATTAFVQSLLDNKQPLHAALTSIAGLTTATDKMLYTTASNKYAVTALTPVARTLLSKTSISDMCTYLGVLSSSSTAASATKLASAKTIQTDLGSTTAVGFDGSNNIKPGVTGTLKVANGGTGLTAAPSLLVNLASTTAANIFAASPRPGITGVLPVANGGTGATSLANITVGNATTAGKLKTAQTIELSGGVNGSGIFDGSGKVTIDTTINAKEKSPAFGICTTPAATAAKTVDITDFTLVEGVRISVNFKNGNTAQNPTLNVSKTGAKELSLAAGHIPCKNLFIKDAAGVTPIYEDRPVDLTYISGQWVVSRSNIWMTPLISGIINNAYWGGLITTLYGRATANSSNMYCGICHTAADTKAKVVTCPEMTFAPIDGTMVLVHMRKGNSVDDITFNVNSKGAFKCYAPNIVVKQIPSQSNICLVYTDTSTSSTTSGRWVLGNISFKHFTEGSIFKVDTAAGTAAKVNTVNLPKERLYVHTDGGRIAVNFSVTNTIANPTLNINSYGAKPLYWPDGTRMTKEDITKGIWEFIYSENIVSGGGFISVRDKPAGDVTSVESAKSADKLSKAQTIQTDLGSTSAASFNGTASIKPGITGTLKVANGGTGATSLANITVGNATTAEKLKTARTITLSGAVTGSVNFDGNTNVTITTTGATIIDGAVKPTKEAVSGVTNMKKGWVNLGSPYGSLKLQWTAANFKDTNRYVDCEFPQTFTTACYSVMVCSGDNGKATDTAGHNTMHYTIISSSMTKSSVRIGRINSQSGGSYTSDWICVWAIGV